MKKIIFIVASFFILGNSFSQEINTPKLDSLFDILSVNNKAMGSIAISKNGKILYAKAIGVIDEIQNTPANTETKYRIGSISKMFTAVIVFQLIEAKKLSLETKLDRYFPNIPNANKITIGMTLNHRTGIFNITEDSNFLKWNSEPISQQEMVEKIEKYPSEFEPNSKNEYSNSNFILLTYIIEKITKKSFKENLEQRICKKLNLKNTFYGGQIRTQNNETASFIVDAKGWRMYAPETDMSVPQGAGAIVSTPTDLNIFIEALFAGKLVKSTSLAQMQTLKDGMGMGMFSVPFGNHKSWGHTGGIDGFHSMLGYFPTDSLAICYIGNGVSYARNDIMIGALSIYFNKQYSLPNFNIAAVSGKVDLNKLVGIYSAAGFPLKITITTDGKILNAQATGQSAFPLEYKGNNTFEFEIAGIELKFDVEKQAMILNQSGRSFVLNKEK